MEEKSNNMERSVTKRHGHPLLKWVVLLCALLLAVLVLQVMILLRTNRIGVEQQSGTAQTQTLVHTQITQAAALHAPAPAQIAANGPDNWPSEMEHAFRDAQTMFNRMDAFDRAFVSMAHRDPFMHFDDGWDMLAMSPRIDMRERDNSYIVLYNLSTLNPSNITVSLNGRMLTIASIGGERSGNSLRESSFATRVRLPGPIGDRQLARATVSNGVLRVSIPKGTSSPQLDDQIVKLL